MLHDPDKESNRKARQKKNLIRFYLRRGLLLLLGLLILAILLIALICKETSVSVEGTAIYSQEEVIDRILDDKLSRRNTVYAFLKNALLPKKNIPFIDSARIRFRSAGQITIEIRQTPMNGYYLLADGTNRAYFNAKGQVTDVSSLVVDGLPSLSGISAEKAKKGDIIPIQDKADRESVLSIYQFFADKSIAISDLKLGENGTVQVSCKNLNISLGSRTNLRDKLKRVPYLLDKIEDMSGTLHLENWTPDNTDVIFEKDQAQMEKEAQQQKESNQADSKNSKEGNSKEETKKSN